MQRNDEAERIIAKVPWSRQKRDLGEETYYDPLVHDAQLLYLLARHFPARLGAVPPTVLEDLAQRGQRQPDQFAIGGLDAAGAGRLRESGRRPPGNSGLRKSARTEASARCTLPSRCDAEERPSPTNAAKVQFSKEGALAAYYASTNRASIAMRRRAAVNQGVEIIREFLDLRRQSGDEGEGGRGVPGPRAAARHPARPRSRRSR